MLLARGVLGIALLLLWVYCIFDAITSESERVRNLPKLLWVVIVVLIPDIGSIMWLVAGRPRRERRSLPYKGNGGVPPEYDRPGRAVAKNPDDDAAFLESLKRRAEEQRRKAEEEARRQRGDEDLPPQA